MSNNFDSDMFEAIAPQGTIEAVLRDVIVRDPERREVVLVMRHAGESNREYMNARRKLDAELRMYGDSVPNEVIRDKLIPIFAQHVVQDWKHVWGKDGKPVPCVPEEVEALLRALAKKRPDRVNQAMGLAMPADHFVSTTAAQALGNG